MATTGHLRARGVGITDRTIWQYTIAGIDREDGLSQLVRQMSLIHIARNHSSIGKFPAEEVAEGLKKGRFVPTDLAWREPMEAWKPLSEFTDLPEVEAEPEDDEGVSVQGEDEMRGNGAEEAGREPPWERRSELGLFAAMIQTVQQVLAAPAKTFATMNTKGGFMGPLRFYGILMTLTTWVSGLYQIAALRVNPEWILGEFAVQITPAEMEQSLWLFMALAPLLVVLGAFFSAGILHAGLVAVGAASKSYEATFRGLCYAVAPASLLQLIPVCGGMAFLLTGIAILVIAQREIQKASSVRVAVAVALPVLLGCGLFLGLYSGLS